MASTFRVSSFSLPSTGITWEITGKSGFYRVKSEKVLGKPNELERLNCLDANRRSMAGCQAIVDHTFSGRPGVAASSRYRTAESFREGLTVPHTWPHMLQCEVLVRKAASVDGLPSRAIVVGKVTSLQREYLVIGYHTAGSVGPLRRQLNPPKAHPQAKGPTTI